jgi:Core-2/I-Branching enzyme
MSEAHISRVADGAYHLYRWSSVMGTAHLMEKHFRKAQQWSTLTRTHAQYVAYDQHVWTQFEAYCRTQVRIVLRHDVQVLPSPGTAQACVTCVAMMSRTECFGSHRRVRSHCLGNIAC